MTRATRTVVLHDHEDNYAICSGCHDPLPDAEEEASDAPACRQWRPTPMGPQEFHVGRDGKG